mmetsp:Transcript_29930/g.82485  ORF Transcript_29930/g.82485 Transcript_29930/m.82485 type:complete len:112 (+) Transcript_29930:292-627(+)
MAHQALVCIGIQHKIQGSPGKGCVQHCSLDGLSLSTCMKLTKVPCNEHRIAVSVSAETKERKFVRRCQRADSPKVNQISVRLSSENRLRWMLCWNWKWLRGWLCPQMLNEP